MTRSTFAMVALLAAGAALPSVTVHAQRQGRGALDPASVSAAEIQQMFDAVALVQAQNQLTLADDQYLQFLPRFKALQEVRRRAQREHQQLIQQLRRLSVSEARADEPQLKERLKALQEQETRAAADIKKAYDAVDEMLDVRQQAKLRVFEENMERRKIELVTRAQVNNRRNLRGKGQP